MPRPGREKWGHKTMHVYEIGHVEVGSPMLSSVFRAHWTRKGFEGSRLLDRIRFKFSYAVPRTAAVSCQVCSPRANHVISLRWLSDVLRQRVSLRKSIATLG